MRFHHVAAAADGKRWRGADDQASVQRPGPPRDLLSVRIVKFAYDCQGNNRSRRPRSQLRPSPSFFPAAAPLRCRGLTDNLVTEVGARQVSTSREATMGGVAMRSGRARVGKLLTALELACWLLPPSRFKNRLLARFGHDVALTAKIMPTIVLGVRKFTIGEQVRINLLNVFRGLSTVRLDDCAIIDSWNWISAHPMYQEMDPEAGTLFMAARARIGSRCYLDCSGTIVIRAFAEVGGQRCLLQTHEIDFEHNRQSLGRITVGHHSFVGSSAIMLKGSRLPDQSLLAANATMTRHSATHGKRGLYVGSPAKWKRETTGEYFDKLTYWTIGAVVEEPMGIMSDDVDNSPKSRVIDPPS